jgi:hypothetical protein
VVYLQSSWLQNGDVLCFLWVTNWSFICFVEESRPTLYCSGQSSWLQIQRSRFFSRPYQIFWEVVGLERGPLSHVITIEELLGRKSSDSGLENREYGCTDPACWPHGTIYPQKLALTSLTNGAHSIGIVRSRTQAMEFFFNYAWCKVYVVKLLIMQFYTSWCHFIPVLNHPESLCLF